MEKIACEWCGELVDYPQLFCGPGCEKAANQPWMRDRWWDKPIPLWVAILIWAATFTVIGILAYVL